MSNLILEIPREDLEKIISRAKQSEQEIIGVFLGRKTQRKRKVEVTEFLTNVTQSRVRFEVDPEEFYTVIERAEAEELDLIGFFHSHPAPPRPSDIDLTYMKFWPNSYWLIIDGNTGNYTAWQYEKTSVQVIPV
ncbi:MAG: M67 family metallopeptidase [Candidatus Korarchaeota archaeon]|nr:M67 family metallopeptidase [Candidatus Korarchaeota archaeon]NIU84134.1 hypothetical protein [Candidatus Thorarchaeota archaeon]NIW14279.1 hypothetical protein [Candidatus Thorarchaeota archaeon]NIW52376.1 hypothetical protein [Candidatus Korarchaeota archaeon]